ncbi:MAG: winged helix-turn-helix domain-containing protein [Hyphomicrobiales bacterium]
MKSRERAIGPRLRVFLEPDFALGPGKAEILEGIKETGSIAAAGRRMGMSYKRAWNLVDAMNKHFRAPVVDAAKGGRAGGGAVLTEFGEEVLTRYRRMMKLAQKAIEPDLKKLMKELSGADAGKSTR